MVAMNPDISLILAEIKARTKWSEVRIANEVGTSQPTINRLLNGQQECRVRTWHAIVELGKRVIEDPAAAEPSSPDPPRPG